MNALQLKEKRRVLSLFTSGSVNRKLENILANKSDGLELENVNDTNKASSLLKHFKYNTIVCDVDKWIASKSSGNMYKFFQNNYSKQSAYWLFVTNPENKDNLVDFVAKDKCDYVVYPCKDAFLASKFNSVLTSYESQEKKSKQSFSPSPAPSPSPSGVRSLNDSVSSNYITNFKSDSVEDILQTMLQKSLRESEFVQDQFMKTFKKIFTEVMDLNKSESLHNHMYVKKKGEYRKLEYQNIQWIKSDSDYLKIQTDNESYFILSTIKKIVDELPPSRFMQIHRSYVVPVDKIDALNCKDRNITISGDQIPVSNTYIGSLKKRLNIY